MNLPTTVVLISSSGGFRGELFFHLLWCIWCGMYKCSSYLLQENSNFQVRYWVNSTEPIFFTVAESDQSNNFMHPPLAIRLWPVAMVPSLTPPQLQNHRYPSGWSQDDPYHSNLDPSSHSPLSLGGWGPAVLIHFCSEDRTGTEKKKKTAYQKIARRFIKACLHVFSQFCSLTATQTTFQFQMPWQ